MAALGHKDVCRLDVAVNNSFGMGGTERIRNLSTPFKHLFKRQRPTGDAMLQRGAFHEFHGNKHLAVLLADFVNCADMRMIQRGRCTRLSPKPFQNLRILGQVIGNKFKCDEPAEGGILGLVDNTHAAAAQHFNDSVMGDDLADH